MIMITGASGLLGNALMESLSGGGREVVGLRSADGDLRDLAATMALFEKHRPEVVYHTAARVHGIMGNRIYPAEMFVDNIKINTNIVEAARQFDCRKIVAVSTVAAYPTGLPFPIREDMIWSGAPHPSEVYYGHAKRVMLAQLQASRQQYGLEFAYALLTNLYGPRDRFDTAHGHVVPSLVAKFHAASLDGSAVSIWGSGIAKRDFLYVDDAAAALVALETAESGAYNVATGKTVSIVRVVEILSAVSGVTNIIWDATKPDGELDRSYDVSRLADLGFAPSLTLEQGLETTYRWYADRYPDVRL